ncbi:hypothetical protein [Streptomyces sp. DSM 118148]|uniref:hypothetical protein n=1 Tax=Streptomyces sp. DSM 118148 TaxID=3448667 RepID=UPI0040402608
MSKIVSRALLRLGGEASAHRGEQFRGEREERIGRGVGPGGALHADHRTRVPVIPTPLQPLVAMVPLQVFVCEPATARRRGGPPRNLTKSVTVEGTEFRPVKYKSPEPIGLSSPGGRAGQ